MVGLSTLIVVAAIACSSSGPDKVDPTATNADLQPTATQIQSTATATDVRPTATATGIRPTITAAPVEPTLSADDILVQLLGGETTVFLSQGDAFVLPAPNLADSDISSLRIGEALFLENWTPKTGLGPLLNARACSSCHVNNGRAQPPLNPGKPADGLLMRLSVPGSAGPVNDPNYGGQFQDDSISDVEPEGVIQINHLKITGQFADGTPYTLLKPVYALEDLAYGPLHPEIMMSPRVAPAMIGMGLLEAIPDEVLLAMTDPDDADGDGISGRVNMVPNRRTGQIDIGRFGWKAGQPEAVQQAAAAFNGDLGITSSLYPVEECTDPQTDCHNLADIGKTTDLAGNRVLDITLFTQTLAVPAMRNIDDPQVRSGAELFLSSGCSSCHTPRQETGEHDVSAVSNQTIFPYTDLLLHDMGEDLADNRPEFAANGTEWRTAPLWGIGLVETVNGHTRFMHDGRARNLTEAILWHGGEGEESRDVFKSLSSEEREALIAFLNAL